MFFIEWMLILLGHCAIACVLFNHVHAFARPKSGKKITEKIIFAFALLPLPFFAYVFYLRFYEQELKLGNSSGLAISAYFWLTKIVAVYFIVRWVYRTSTARLPARVKLTFSKVHDLSRTDSNPLLIGFKARLFGAIPGNQVLKVKEEHWDFEFPDLPDGLHDFKICQLSDLHFTGLVGKEYFGTVFKLVNKYEPDLIVITGDLLDDDCCLDWIEKILSRLSARHGIYFILGNHDLLITDQEKYFQRLEGAGFKTAADGIWHRVDVGDSMLLIAGNEYPWYPGIEKLPKVPSDRSNEFLMLLAHSPDQIGWAVSREFDLVFAGHTHGGQICLPVVGPIIAPSRYGIKYASGTFLFRKTLMHVSRGLSGDEPVRINCLPEIGFFTLRKQPA